MKRILMLGVVLLLAASISAQTTAAGVSLAAATGTGAGSALVANRTPVSMWTWATVTTGSPTGVTVKLEGSIDGTNWFTLDTMGTAVGGWGANGVAAADMRHVANKPVTRIRCNLSALSGGTSPTVTCNIAGF